MSGPLVRMEHVEKAFRPRRGLRVWRQPGPASRVLQDVSFEVPAGGRMALLGANGAGKTTILKIVAGLLIPDGGSVEVCGFDALRQPRQAHDAVTYVLADERSFHWRLTARENLEFFGALDGLPGKYIAQRIDWLLQRLDLTAAKEMPFWQFSVGMKQRLAIARALLHRPKVLLMDEPTRSVDAAHASEVWQLVREEVDDGEGCLVVVTHHLQEALSLCDQVAILADGRLALQTSTEALKVSTADLDGFTLTVRGMTPRLLGDMQAVAGVRELRICAEIGGEQTLELWTRDSDFPLGDFLGALTAADIVICSLQRRTPLQAVLERLLQREAMGAVA
ncbi:MAG: ABC transporter ATP-binding protein [Hyphomicrobiales bacterium]